MNKYLFLVGILCTGCNARWNYGVSFSKIVAVAPEKSLVFKNSIRYSRNSDTYIYATNTGKNIFYFKDNHGSQWGPFQTVYLEFSGFDHVAQNDIPYFSYQLKGKIYLRLGERIIKTHGKIQDVNFLKDGTPIIIAKTQKSFEIFSGGKWCALEGSRFILKISKNRRNYLIAAISNGDSYIWKEHILKLAKGRLISFGISDKSDWFLAVKNGLKSIIYSKKYKIITDGIIEGWPDFSANGNLGFAYYLQRETFFWYDGSTYGPYFVGWANGNRFSHQKDFYAIIQNPRNDTFEIIKNGKTILIQKQFDADGPAIMKDGQLVIGETDYQGNSYFLYGNKRIGPWKAVGHIWGDRKTDMWYALAESFDLHDYLVINGVSHGPFDSISAHDFQISTTGELFYKAFLDGKWYIYGSFTGFLKRGPGDGLFISRKGGPTYFEVPFGVKRDGNGRRLFFGNIFGRRCDQIIGVRRLDAWKFGATVWYWALVNSKLKEIKENFVWL